MRRAVGVSTFLLLALSNSAPGAQSPPGDSSANKAEAAEVTIGYLFLDGRYIAPPYRMELREDELMVNGQFLAEVRRHRFGRRGWRGGPRSRDRRGFSGGGAFRGPDWRLSPYRDWLESDYVVFVWQGRPPVAITAGSNQITLFRALLASPPRSDSIDAVVNGLPQSADQKRVREWLASYEPPADLTERMRRVVEESDAMLADQNAKLEAATLLSTVSYPLTVLGMVLAVVALGHLLMSRPKPVPGAQSAAPEVTRAAAISVALVALLSAFDLAWTILASQTGTMTELNPLGSRWIDNPERLIAFKATATAVGCGLLLVLRRHSFARLASWWMCLVLTVVTFRWLVFNSMMMG